MSENDNALVHFISHVHDTDTIYVKYECRAGKGAQCHTYPDCECDGWSDCDHTKVQHDECWTEPWMNDSCKDECFTGPNGTPVHDGPVHISFNGDCIDWEYLKAATK
ncbi:MAG TPA: hypothetical protein DEV93_03480 [Chloroflexi bacterium]|jgi:hypothetical protein|nr:hypothetical protein [Chloroflexota bacterium]